MKFYTPKCLLNVLLISLIFTQSCKDDNVAPNIIVEINDSLILTPTQTLSETNPELHLIAKTQEMFPCQNVNLNYTHNHDGNLLSISFNSLSYQDCIDTLTHAIAEVNLGNLPVDTYNLFLNLNNNEIINDGRLFITNDKYIFQTNSSYGIDFNYRELNKIPPNTFWGYAVFPNESSRDQLYPQLYNILMEYSMTHLFIDGEYGFFKVSDNDIQRVSRNNNYYQNNLFLFRHNNNLDDLQSAINDFRSNYEEVDIYLITSDGQKL